MATPRVNRELLSEVERWLAEAVPASVITQRAVSKYGVSSRTVARYVAKVYARWEAEEKAQRPRRRAEFRQMLRHLWRLALEANDYRSAASVAQRMAKLDGLEAPREHRVEASVGYRDIRGMSPAERNAEIERLLERRRHAFAAR